jgi:glycosyltransferase involved in cell wall biosynthesis
MLDVIFLAQKRVKRIPKLTYLSVDHRPKVSVIIPTYNHKKFISEAIQSVLDQTFRDFELIIIDDGSTDGTANVVNSFSDGRIKYVYQSNCGRSYARNRALNIASGRYITFLDSDDLYLPDKLQLQVDFLDTHPEFGMVYTSAYCMDEAGILLNDSYMATVSGQIYKDIAFYVPVTITLPTVMARREVFDKVGGFDEKMERFEDTDMWRRIAKEYLVGAIPDFTCKLRTHSDNALSGQDPRKIEAAIKFYINKIFSEDSSISLEIRRNGASKLYYHYAIALFSVPARVVGLKLLLISISFDRIPSRRLLYVGYCLLLRRPLRKLFKPQISKRYN